MSESTETEIHAVVVSGEDSESDDEDNEVVADDHSVAEPRKLDSLGLENVPEVKLQSNSDAVTEHPLAPQTLTQPTSTLSRHSQDGVGSLHTSILHRKLQEANLKWLTTINNAPETVCRDIGSTMKRVGARLDKTQAVAVDGSNKVRSSIENLKACLGLMDNIMTNSKTVLPTYKAPTPRVVT